MVEDLSRYSCQMALPDFGRSVQEKLKNSKVLIVGLGGLGCPAAQYLTAAGIGTIGLADHDTISISNLHRQILYNESEVGLKKTAVAIKRLICQNSGIIFNDHPVKVQSENVLEIVKEYDIIIDATDNFETRYLLNDACVLSGKPLVYGAIYQYEGQMAVWNLKNEDGTFSPNYRDLFPDVNPSQIPNCSEGGVIPTIAGIIGCLQANAAINFLSGKTHTLASELFIFDIQSLQSRKIRLNKVSKTQIRSLEVTLKIETISPYQLEEEFQNTYQLIDVRTHEERKQFNIGGIHIPVESIEKEIIKLNYSKPLLFYCSSGKRSAIAARIVKSKYPSLKIYSLEGGLEKWNGNGE